MSETRAARRREDSHAQEVNFAVVYNAGIFKTKEAIEQSAGQLRMLVEGHALLKRFRWTVKAALPGTEEHKEHFTDESVPMRLLVMQSTPTQARGAAINLFNMYSSGVVAMMVDAMVEQGQ